VVRLIRFFALALVSALGCTESGPPLGCGAEPYKALVGQPLSAALEAAVPEGGYKVDDPLPDGTVTLEEFAGRLRVSVNGDKIIWSVGCG
jgi:hypothetical protein